MQVAKVKINSIKTNPKNPRLIKDDKFKKLVNSIKEFPQMLELRPIVVDENNIILGGNMRHKACIEAGLKEVFIVQAKDLTEQQKDEFIVKDNVGFGEWDWDILANEWDTEKLEDWNINLENYDPNKIKEPPKTDLKENKQLLSKTNFDYIRLFKKTKDLNGIELKKIKEPEYFDRISFVFYQLIKKYIKNKNTCIICPPPRRHKEWNLAQKLTHYLGEKLECNYEINQFKANSLTKYDPNIELEKPLIYENYIIIDDIITTGQTINKCVELLDNKNFIIFVVIDNN